MSKVGVSNFLHFRRWFRRRSESAHRQSARRQRPRIDGMVSPFQSLVCDARYVGKRRDRHRQHDGGTRIREYRRMDSRRNMFGPVRGPWPDDEWKGWWGDEPPYHVPTFVLTHHAREILRMKGGTEFHFVTDGIESALRQAKTAAGNKDVRIGGGVSTVRQFLRAGLIDELHLAMRPILLGDGENLFTGLDWRALGYTCVESVAGERATHVILRKIS
jgi:dihydrofolate reductase